MSSRAPFASYQLAWRWMTSAWESRSWRGARYLHRGPPRRPLPGTRSPIGNAHVRLPEDVLGVALREPGPHPLAVDQNDGSVFMFDVAWWLREPSAIPPTDIGALDLVHGPVLDVGCATGRHVQMLRARGVDARGIDTCQEAIRLARQAGQPCEVADVWHYRGDRKFHAVLALGGNLGVAGRSSRLPSFLRKLSSFLEVGGVLLVSSQERPGTSAPGSAHLGQRFDGAYAGDVLLRLRLGAAVSTWFEWVWVDLDVLREQAASAGLRVSRVLRWEYKYVAELTRDEW